MTQEETTIAEEEAMETKERYWDILTYLLMPEDSSVGGGRCPGPGQGQADGYPCWLAPLKAVLWGMIAVGLPILIAIFRQ